MKKKLVFYAIEALAIIALILWIVFTIAAYSSSFLTFFPKASLAVPESGSSDRISGIPGLATVTQIGVVLLDMGIAIFIIYFGLMFLLYKLKINKTKIFITNICIYSLVCCLIIVGTLFVSLNL
ncbi:MAG: hypothetical protein K2H56_02880 [Malacoplasma sp.]|nr:hypothetical protein [Malacoplasma sp.]